MDTLIAISDSHCGDLLDPHAQGNLLVPGWLIPLTVTVNPDNTACPTLTDAVTLLQAFHQRALSGRP